MRLSGSKKHAKTVTKVSKVVVVKPNGCLGLDKARKDTVEPPRPASISSRRAGLGQSVAGQPKPKTVGGLLLSMGHWAHLCMGENRP